MQTVRVRLADMSFMKTGGPSARDEQQLQKLVKNNTRSNGRVQWAVIVKKFCPKDRHRWGATTASALRNLHKRRTKRNRYDHRHLQFKQDDEDDSELSEEEELLLLSEHDFSDDTIDISPNFDGFDRALGRNAGCCDKEHIMLAYILDDLVKGI
jgi:hypothetical protein